MNEYEPLTDEQLKTLIAQCTHRRTVFQSKMTFEERAYRELKALRDRVAVLESRIRVLTTPTPYPYARETPQSVIYTGTSPVVARWDEAKPGDRIHVAIKGGMDIVGTVYGNGVVIWPPLTNAEAAEVSRKMRYADYVIEPAQEDESV